MTRQVLEQRDISIPVPDIGGGNPWEAELMRIALNLPPTQTAELFFLAGFFVEMASDKHVGLTHKAAAAQTYTAESERVRGGWKARIFQRLLTRQALLKINKPRFSAHLTPQNMLGIGLAHYFKNRQFVGVTYPDDGRGKADPANTANHYMHQFFWSETAYQCMLAAVGPERVHLMKPLHPGVASTYGHDNAREADTLAQELEKDISPIYIKLSGSGGDPEVVDQLIANLKNNPHTQAAEIHLVCEHPGFWKFCLDRRIPLHDDNFFYGYMAECAKQKLTPPRVITFPSEQVKHMVTLQELDMYVPVIFFYTRGKHELWNLAEAIQKGLTHFVCVPEDGEKQLQADLAECQVPASLYTLLDPAEIRPEHFVAPKPEEKWVLPSQAQDLHVLVNAILENNHS